MTFYHDFSNWASSLFDYSKDLLSFGNVLEIEDERFILSPNANSIWKEWIPIDARLFWLSFGVGVECLTKAVLLKHEISIIKSKKANPASVKNIKNQEIRFVYNYFKRATLKSQRNKWLENELQRKKLIHPQEINTFTLGAIYNGKIDALSKKLSSQQKMTDDERIFLNESIELFTTIRRNVDAHIFLKETVYGSINGDLEVYLRMINLLIEIYYR